MPKHEYTGPLGALHQKLDQMEASLNAIEKQKADDLAAERDKTVRTTLRTALANSGVSPQTAKHAVGYLVDSAKRVRMNERGALVFLDGAYEMPLDKGLREWLQSEDAYPFRPQPAPATTEGTEKTEPQKNTPTRLSREQVAEQLQTALSANSFYIG